MFRFEICTPEGRKGNANFKTNNTEPLTQEITSPLTRIRAEVHRLKQSRYVQINALEVWGCQSLYPGIADFLVQQRGFTGLSVTS